MRFKQVVTNKERAINANNIKSLRDESKFNDVYINEASLRGGQQWYNFSKYNIDKYLLVIKTEVML